MQNGEFFLDTNISVYFLNGKPSVVEKFRQHSSIKLPLITIGELLYGAKNSDRSEENLKAYRDFIRQFPTVIPTAKTAEIYSTVKFNLRKKGHPIPENDIWIASIALQYAATLVTNDSHFENVDGLRTVNWASA